MGRGVASSTGAITTRGCGRGEMARGGATGR